MDVQRLFAPFRRLQWQLTLSYTWTTVLVLLLLEIVLAVFDFWALSANVNANLASTAEVYATGTLAYFDIQPQERERIQSWLDENVKESDYQITYMGYVAVIDMHGSIIATRGSERPPAGATAQAVLPVVAARQLSAILAARKNPPDTFTHQDAQGTTIILVPIREQSRQVQGALLIIAKKPHIQLSSLFFLSSVLIVVGFLLSLICAPLIGSVFGFFTARRFIRRFQRLSTVVDKWGQADFSAFIQDISSDEIGQFARRLDAMAEQLQDALHTRRELAAIQERQHLARDLHDSVKQLMFAVTLEMGSAKLQLPGQPDAALVHLSQAETMVTQVQRELAAIMRQSSPGALEDKSFSQALQEYIVLWQRQNNIKLHLLQIQVDQPLTRAVANVLYRVSQEALSNVARHSRASEVQFSLLCTPKEPGEVQLLVSDNGHGFEPDSATHSTGLGLASMRERVQALGGRIEIQSDSTGTSIKVVIALETGTPGSTKRGAESHG